MSLFKRDENKYRREYMREYRLNNPRAKKVIDIIVDGKRYSFEAPAEHKPGTKDLLKKLIRGIKKWKQNPTQENWIKIFRVPLGPDAKTTSKQLRTSVQLRNFLQNKPMEGALWKGIFEKSNMKKLLNLSEADVSKIKTYTPEVFASTRGLFGSKAAALRTPLQKGTNDLPEIVKIFDKYKYNTDLSNLKNQDAVLDLIKKNSIIANRFKQEGVPLTFKNLKTRISRAHNAVIKNTLDKGMYAGIFEGLSTADRQNFLNNAQKMFGGIINRTFQSQLIDTLKGDQLKQATDKLSKFSNLRKFLSDRMGHMGTRHDAFIQLDHPISLAALDKSKNLNQALRVNPIAGDINLWKNKIDKRLNVLQKNKDVKGLRAINEVNQVLFGKGAPSFTAGAEGISKIKGLPADFRKANMLEQLRGSVGLHEQLKTNIPNIKPETWKASGLNQAKVTSSLEALKSWDPKVLSPLIDQWAKKDPQGARMLEKIIPGCKDGCLALAVKDNPNAFSEALKKTPGAARSFLGMLGRGGVKAAPFAAVAAAGALAEPLVKQFRNDDPTTYMTDENQQKGVLLSLVEAETPQVDEEILKWQYPGIAAGAAAAIPGSSAVYGARRKPFKSIKRGIDRAAMGPARAALGPVGKFLAGSFSPLAVAASLPIHIGAQIKGGAELEDIATDPVNWAGPAFASAGAKAATRGMPKTGILSKALRMGMSPAGLRVLSRGGIFGLLAAGGLKGYDIWENSKYK